MVKQHQLGGEMITHLPSHLGGTAQALAGTAIALIPPAGASCAILEARGADVSYQLGGSASVSSYGFVPDGEQRIILPVDNFGTVLSVFATAGTVHVQYYQS